MSLSPYDLGIVLYLSKLGTETYVDRKSVTRTAQAIAATYKPSDEVNVGRMLNASVDVHCATGAGNNTFVVKVEARRDDTANPGIFGYAPVLTVRSDTGVPAFEHTIDPATAPDLRLQTESQYLSSTLRVSGKATNAPGAGDLLVAGLTVG